LLVQCIGPQRHLPSEKTNFALSWAPVQGVKILSTMGVRCWFPQTPFVCFIYAFAMSPTLKLVPTPLWYMFVCARNETVQVIYLAFLNAQILYKCEFLK